MISLLLAGLMASAACAGLVSGADSFGIYFDTAGNTNCTTAAAMDTVTAYLLLMNPAGPTEAFECSVSMSGAPYMILSTVTGGCLCMTDGGFCGPYQFAHGCEDDFPVTEDGAIVLVTWRILLQAPSELLFHIGPSKLPSLPGGLPVLLGDSVLRQGAVASGDVNLPVAGINAAVCPTSDEINTFGAVKGLFR